MSPTSMAQILPSGRDSEDGFSAYNHIFITPATPDETLRSVHKKIWHKLNDGHAGFQEHDMELYTPTALLKTYDGAEAFERAVEQLDLDTPEGWTNVRKLYLTQTAFQAGFSPARDPEELHVLVIVCTSGVLDLWWSKRHKGALPPISDLASILDFPLTEAEKLPIPVSFMSRLLCPPYDPQDRCTPADLQVLFRSSSASDTPLDPTDNLSILIFLAVTRPPPRGRNTDNLLISFWDRNVRAIIEFLVQSGTSARGGGDHKAIAALRPDFAFVLNRICVFWGEETCLECDDPKKDLATKLAWVYDPAPYVFGYYAIGTRLTLVAITPPPHAQALPVVHDLVSVDLSLRADRIMNILHLINLVPLLQALSELVQPSCPTEFFADSERDNGTVEIAGHGVIKTFTNIDKVARIAHLQKVYQLLQEKNVPHVDQLQTTFGTTAILYPRGMFRLPQDESELLGALICVLEALEVLHQSPPVYHRDIRWHNLLRRSHDPNAWFLIDWDDAGFPPTTAQRHFARRTHAPAVFEDAHGAEVDLWGVGELIYRCRLREREVSVKLRELGGRMRAGGMGASEALREVRALRDGVLNA
ncbi:hypothetical protein DXG01_013769 [Tephrocybe rancida]|nr:hypothetical protein DXG01_013769 [Tephrocybe rancida]